MTQLKWGVIAAGGIADRRMIPAMIASNKDKLIAVMDKDAAKAREIAEKFGVPYSFENEAQLLGIDEIEAVYIASPVYCHLEHVKAAADAGKNILLEKPVGLNAEQAGEMVQYCAQRSVKLGVGFMMRFATLHQKLKQILNEERIGKLVNVTAQFSCWYPEIEGAWRQNKALSGGGALMDMGIHLIDLIQYLSSSRITKVAALNERLRFSYEVEDSSSLLVRFDNGMIGNINTNFNIPDAAARWQVSFFGTKGRIIGDTTIGQQDGGRLLVIGEEKEKGYEAVQDALTANEEVITAEYGDLFAFELEAYANSVKEGSSSMCDGEQAVYDQKVTDAAYRSSETGGFVNVESIE